MVKICRNAEAKIPQVWLHVLVDFWEEFGSCLTDREIQLQPVSTGFHQAM